MVSSQWTNSLLEYFKARRTGTLAVTHVIKAEGLYPKLVQT